MISHSALVKKALGKLWPSRSDGDSDSGEEVMTDEHWRGKVRRSDLGAGGWPALEKTPDIWLKGWAT